MGNESRKLCIRKALSIALKDTSHSTAQTLSAYPFLLLHNYLFTLFPLSLSFNAHSATPLHISLLPLITEIVLFYFGIQIDFFLSFLHEEVIWFPFYFSTCVYPNHVFGSF
ncbi:hypothetical protein VNO77_24198 [Canavalia gladiata]|uniref:Uncharacterized protein n=1 Tax=Canavalia gladiata TaxID=3824 RepID=A0AAN9L947_CANGL